MDARLLSKLVADLTAFFAWQTGVEVAAIFGSVASGTDTAASDIDVIVIGDVSELRLNADLAPLGRKYGHKINAGVWTAGEIGWLLVEGDVVIRSILGGNIVPLKGELPSLPNAATGPSITSLLDDNAKSEDVEFEPGKLDIKLKPPEF